MGRPVPMVLLVEDQPQLQRALRINLRALRYEVLTASTPGGKIGVLDVGADDCVTKPFAMGELPAGSAPLCAAPRRDGQPAQG